MFLIQGSTTGSRSIGDRVVCSTFNKMNFFLFLFFYLVAIFSRTLASIQLISSGPATLRPGESLRLVCKVTGVSLTDSSYVWNWIRQPAGKGLEWVARIYPHDGRTWYASSLRSRTTISSETSKSEFYLQLNSVIAADSAVYYCARGLYWGGPFDYWGDGTSVLVSSATATAPDVFPLSPCCQDQSEDNITIGCLVTGYYPEPVSVEWNSGAITTGIRTFPPLVERSTGHYTLSSQLTIPTATWNSEDIQCHVTHAATSSSINQDIEHCTSHEPVAPQVQLLHSSCDSRSPDPIIELVCIVSGFFPKDVKVDWLVGRQSKTSYSVTDLPRKDADGYTFSTTSRLNVSQADWMTGTVYTCKVNHAGSQTQLERTAKKCEDDSNCPSGDIYIYLQHPTPEDLYINRDAKISCVAGNLKSEEGLKLTWAREKQGALKPEPLNVTAESNGTYTAVGNLPITVQDWIEGGAFTCTVVHPDLSEPVTRRIAKSPGKRTPPNVYVFPPHQGELGSQNEMLTLTCMVKGFTPADISVQWLKDNNALPDDEHINTPVLKDNQEDTHFLYSKLAVPRNDWDRGSTYTCMVVHEAFTMKFIQRTVERSQEINASIENDYNDEKEELEHLWATIFVFFILFLLSVCYSAMVTMVKVKWLFSTMVHLKKPPGPDYKNILQRPI